MISSYQFYFYIVGITFSHLFIFFGYQLLKIFSAPPVTVMRYLKLAWVLTATTPILFFLVRYLSWAPIEILVSVPAAKALASAVNAPQLPINISFKSLLLYGYLLGLLTFGIRLAVNLFRLFSLKQHFVPGFIQSQEVRFLKNISTPFSVGIFKSYIYFPTELLGWSQRDVELAMEHELHHCKNHDCGWKIIAEILNTFFFFLPTQWYLAKRFEDEMEYYCDQQTIINAQSSVKEYGTFLLWISEIPRRSFIFANNINDSTLKRRVLSMKSRMINRPALNLILGIAIVTGAIGSIALAASDKVKTQYLVSSKIFIDGKLISSPRIALVQGETATIRQDSINGDLLELSLIVDEASLPQPGQFISLDMKIKRVAQGNTTEAHPQLIVRNGEEGTVEIGNDSSPTPQPNLLMTVTAQELK